jgi:hypothetical protein
MEMFNSWKANLVGTFFEIKIFLEHTSQCRWRENESDSGRKFVSLKSSYTL